MPDRRRFLILGASGLLGRHLLAQLGPDRSIATYRTHPIEGGIAFDASSMRLRDTILSGPHDIDAAFLLYGVTTLDDCARDPLGTSLINVESLKRAIDDLSEAGVKPIFASSDAVFDGRFGMRTERDPPNPVLTYGKQKLQVERYLQSKDRPSAIARLSKLLSAESEPRNLFNEWAEQMERGEVIRCATDLVFSPADVNDAAQALVRMAEQDLSGIFHVCGPRPISRLDLLNTLIAALRKVRNIQPRVELCEMQDLRFHEPRPLDVSMDAAKLYATLGLRFRDMDDLCSDFVRRRYGIERDRLRNRPVGKPQ